MNPVMIVRSVEIRALPVYTCVGCGAKEVGSGTTTDKFLGHWSPDDAADLLRSAMDGRNVSNSRIPIGWAGYGMSEHRCPACQ